MKNKKHLTKIFIILAVAIAGLSYVLFPRFTEEQRKLSEMLSDIRADIIFDSNRSGTFGIHIFSHNNLTVRPLYDSPMHEINPDASPDGRYVVFAKGKSAERGRYFDIWIVERDGSGARELAKNGAYPTFHNDGKKVIFERGHRTILSVDVSTGKETILFDTQGTPFEGHQVFLPRLSPDGKSVAVTSTKGTRYTNYVIQLDNIEFYGIGKGCEPFWTQSGEEIFWITDIDAKHLTKVMKYDVAKKTNEEVLDNSEPRGIDYFPVVPADNKYLLFSSGAKRRDYLKGDYQVFLRNLETSETLTITNDTFNNRWPKFLKIPQE